MTDNAARKALEHIKELFRKAPWMANPVNGDGIVAGCTPVTYGDLVALAALRSPQPAMPREPVAWICWYHGNCDATALKSRADDWIRLGRKVEPLYDAPPPAMSREEVAWPEGYQASSFLETLKSALTAGEPFHILEKRLGKLVREIWIKWANKQSAPKPTWLVPYEGLNFNDQQVDDMIGVGLAIWGMEFQKRLSLPAAPANRVPVAWQLIQQDDRFAHSVTDDKGVADIWINAGAKVRPLYSAVSRPHQGDSE